MENIPFPTEPATPGDLDWLSDEEVERDFQVILRRVRQRRKREVIAVIIACAVGFVVGGAFTDRWLLCGFVTTVLALVLTNDRLARMRRRWMATR